MDYDLIASFNEEKERWDVRVNGEIDLFNSGEFKDRLNALCDERNKSLHIDCAELSYIDSTGMGSLVSVLKSVKLYGGDIILHGLRQHLLKLFKITNLDKVFIIEGDDND